MPPDSFADRGVSPRSRALLSLVRYPGFLPEDREELNILLNIYLLEKALYELGYELNNRPDWVRIPLIGILQLLHTAEKAA